MLEELAGLASGLGWTRSRPPKVLGAGRWTRSKASRCWRASLSELNLGLGLLGARGLTHKDRLDSAFSHFALCSQALAGL